MSKKGLGRGLQALLPGSSQVIEPEGVLEIPLKDIVVNKNQPRVVFNDEKLRELANSILEHGVIQPVIVRKNENGVYELVAGERRWRACQLAGLQKIPAIVKSLSEKETTELALIENIQREDLNPIEEAVAYNTLMEEYGLTQEELSRRVGKSRSFIANSVRLLTLSVEIRKMVSEGLISAGHARALMGLSGSMDREMIARKIVDKGLSVRQVEGEVKQKTSSRPVVDGQKSLKKDVTLDDLEEQLRKRFSTKVLIKHGKNNGRIELEYYGTAELQRILELLLGEVNL